MISLEDDIAQSMEQAVIFHAFLQDLARPTPAQLWLERAATQLKAERDPYGQKKQGKERIVLRLLKRDGPDCWFCGKHLEQDVSIEHLQPLALGGNWGDGNLALAHRGCNKAAGHLSRVKKEALREEMRSRQINRGEDGESE
jgi:5-methylcytosine-specific restriction endonuclease McrA